MSTCFKDFTDLKERGIKSRQVSLHTNVFLNTECGEDDLSNKHDNMFSTINTVEEERKKSNQ